MKEPATVRYLHAPYVRRGTFVLLLACTVLANACLKQKSFGLDANSPDLIGFTLGALVLGAASVLVSSGTVAVSESDTGTTGSYTVRLNSAPAADVSVTLTTTSTAGISVDQSTLTFTSTNFSAEQTVTVSAVNDTARNATSTDITHTLSSSDSTYDGLTATKTVARSGDDEKYLFVTTGTHTGNLGGVSGADSICNSDSARPDTSLTYSAMLADGTNRIACVSPNCSPSAGTTDWRLTANTNYARGSDGTLILQTNANAIDPLTLASSFTGTTIEIWTGLGGGWTVGSNCSLWASGAGGQSGTAGIGNSVTTNGLNNGTFPCNQLKHLVCVEQ